MALRDEMARSGRWLFRYRSWIPPLLLVPLVLAAPRTPGPDGPGLPDGWTAAGLALAVAGLAIRALVVGTAPKGTSGKNRALQVASKLSTTGAYSVVRHPLYLGNLLLWLGPAVAVGRWWPPVLVALVCLLYYERIILAEEEFLGSAFGAAYLEWAARTPAIVPRLGLWIAPQLPFSLKTVLRLEYYALVSTVTMFALLEAGTVYRQTGRPGLDRFWLALLGAAVAIGAVLRFLQRHTEVLDVEGR